MKKRKGRRVKRKRRAKPRRGSSTTLRGATRFDEHVKIVRHIAKKLGKKVAKLTGKPRKKSR